MSEQCGGEIARRSLREKGAPDRSRASAAFSPLASLIVTRMHTLALSRRELAERLNTSPSTLSRLLSGKIHWTRITPHILADALKLSDPERERLLELCGSSTQRLHAFQAATISTITITPSHIRGRHSREASTPVAQLLGPLMAERGMTRTTLAQALGVRASTVTRLMNTAHTSSHIISAQRVSDVLGLQGIARREFLQRALSLGAFALVAGRSAPSVMRFRSFDLDQFEDEMRATQRLLDAGQAYQALQQAQTLYDASINAAFQRTHKQMAKRRIEAGLLLGRAQEAALPWGLQRADRTTETYNLIDRQILSVFTPREFAQYYARLYERRAPLYREKRDYAESLRQFTLAIEVFMPYVDDVALLALLYRNRAHVWATQGKEREWRNDLNCAERMSNRATGESRAQLEGLLVYGEAEGYKRLAGAAASDDVARQRMYAKKAIDSFLLARALTEGVAESHQILLDVSLAQTYLWIDAEEAALQARALFNRALATYPSLIGKCEQTIAQAVMARKK